MPVRRIVLLATLGALLAPPARGQSWSPDGRWLALVGPGRPADPAGRWLLDAGPQGPRPADERPAASRLWAVPVGPDAATGEPVLLAECDGPITRPAWRRDGAALAYGRLALEAGRPAGLELVVQTSAEDLRVVRSWSAAPGDGPDDLDRFELAWSPDGTHLALTRPDAPGLLVIRAEDGRTRHELPGARRPSWSPGSDRLAFAVGGAAGGLELLDLRNGQVRRLADGREQDRLPPAAWLPDGRSLIRMALDARITPPGRDDVELDLLRLDRIGVDRGDVEKLYSLAGDPVRDRRSLETASLGLDPDGGEAIYALPRPDVPTPVTRVRLRDGETRSRMFPLHQPIAPTRVEVSPAPRRADRPPLLALRLGDGGPDCPVALLDTADESLRPVVPDEDARDAWLALLLHAARLALRDEAPADAPEGWDPATRPTPLPSPGELDEDGVTMPDLRRLARLGRPLALDPARPGASPERLRLLAEARLVFGYLAGAYDACTADLESPILQPDDPDGRLRLLGLRAQILMGQGHLDRAEGVVQYLQARARALPTPIPDGPGAIPPPPPAGWPDALADHLADLRRPRPEGPAGPEIPFIPDLPLIPDAF